MTYTYESKYPAQCPFLRACGLERGEAWQLRVGDVIWRDRSLCVLIREYRSLDQVVITEHLAPVIPGQEQVILHLVEGCPRTNECLAARRSQYHPGASCTRCAGSMGAVSISLTIRVEDRRGREMRDHLAAGFR